MKVHRVTLSSVVGCFFLANSIFTAPWPKPHPMIPSTLAHAVDAGGSAAELARVGKGAEGAGGAAQAAHDATGGLHGAKVDPAINAAHGDSATSTINVFREGTDGPKPETLKGAEDLNGAKPPEGAKPETPKGAEDPNGVKPPEAPEGASAALTTKPPSPIKLAAKKAGNGLKTVLGYIGMPIVWVQTKIDKFMGYLGTKLLYSSKAGRERLTPSVLAALDEKAKENTWLQNVFDAIKVNKRVHHPEMQNSLPLWKVPAGERNGAIIYNAIRNGFRGKGAGKVHAVEGAKGVEAGAEEISTGAKGVDTGAEETSTVAKGAGAEGGREGSQASHVAKDSELEKSSVEGKDGSKPTPKKSIPENHTETPKQTPEETSKPQAEETSTVAKEAGAEGGREGSQASHVAKDSELEKSSMEGKDGSKPKPKESIPENHTETPKKTPEETSKPPEVKPKQPSRPTEDEVKRLRDHYDQPKVELSRVQWARNVARKLHSGLAKAVLRNSV